jgi:hypothetical protein
MMTAATHQYLQQHACGEHQRQHQDAAEARSSSQPSERALSLQFMCGDCVYASFMSAAAASRHRLQEHLAVVTAGLTACEQTAVHHFTVVMT